MPIIDALLPARHANQGLGKHCNSERVSRLFDLYPIE